MSFWELADVTQGLIVVEVGEVEEEGEDEDAIEEEEEAEVVVEEEEERGVEKKTCSARSRPAGRRSWIL